MASSPSEPRTCRPRMTISALHSCASNMAESTEALKWAEEGLWQFEDNPDERLISFASDLYRRIGREEDADKLLWRAFERRPSIELYERLKAAAGTDRMSADAVRDRALAWLRAQLGKPAGRSGMRWSSPTELLVRLAMAEGLLTDAWTVVNGHGCSEELLDQLAEASEHSHPAEALKAYADRVERMVGLGGQSNYECACRIVGRMRLLRERSWRDHATRRLSRGSEESSQGEAEFHEAVDGRRCMTSDD